MPQDWHGFSWVKIRTKPHFFHPFCIHMLSVIILPLSLQYSAHALPLSHSPINLPLINLELIVLKASGPQENKPQSIIAPPPCFTWKKDLVLVCHHTHTVVFCRVIFGSPLFHVLPFMYNCYVFISL